MSILTKGKHIIPFFNEMKIDAAGIGANKIIWKKKSFYFKIQKKKKKKNRTTILITVKKGLSNWVKCAIFLGSLQTFSKSIPKNHMRTLTITKCSKETVTKLEWLLWLKENGWKHLLELLTKVNIFFLIFFLFLFYFYFFVIFFLLFFCYFFFRWYYLRRFHWER